MDRGAWWATVHGVEKSQTRLSMCVRACTHTHTHTHTRRLNLFLPNSWRCKFTSFLEGKCPLHIQIDKKFSSHVYQVRLTSFKKTLWVHVLFQIRMIIDTYTISLERAMAPHSSTLAWKIPWTEETGRLQSMGSLGVRHD